MKSCMQTLSAKDAKYGFGRLIDLAQAKPGGGDQEWAASYCCCSLGRGIRATEGTGERQCR